MEHIILLIKHIDGYIMIQKGAGEYYLPNGHTQSGETMRDAAMRIAEAHIEIQPHSFRTIAEDSSDGATVTRFVECQIDNQKYYISDEIKRASGYANVVASSNSELIVESDDTLPEAVIKMLRAVDYRYQANHHRNQRLG